MKKMICVMLSLVMVLGMLSGCSLFATSGGETQSGGSANEPIKMTESYTFEDPSDIEFDKRYVIACDQNSQMVSSAADYGMLAAYIIVYAKEDAPVRSYEYYVCKDADSAKALAELYASSGATLVATDADAAVVFSTLDGETMEATLLTYQSYGMIAETTVSAYIAFYSGAVGGTVQ